MDPYPAPNRADFARPYILFLVVLVAFVFFGSLFQAFLGMHVGVIVAQVVIIFGGALFYRRLRDGEGVQWPSLRHAGTTPGVFVLVALTSIAVGLLANLLGSITVELIPGLRETAQAYQESVENLLLHGPVLQQVLGAVAVAVVAPLAEETLFRGAILAEQRQTQRVATAVVVNGLLFSLMHLNPMAFVPLAIVGALFAHLTVRTMSLWPAIVGHAALNTVNGVVLPRIAMDMAQEEAASLGELGIGVLLLGPLAAALWWATVRRM